jgi:hypothetical protein
MYKKYSQEKDKFYATLFFTWLFLTGYLLFGLIGGLIILSLPLFSFRFLFLFLTTFFLLYGIDLMNRYMMDWKKMFLFGVSVSGFVFTLFTFGTIEKTPFITGGYYLRTTGPLFFWVLVIITQPLLLFLYYCVKIYLKTSNKKIALINLCGGIIFSVFTLILITLRLDTFSRLSCAIGALISTLSFYKYPKLLQILKRSSQDAKMKIISRLLPICANCKRIRDSEGKWHQIEVFLTKASDLEFTHGICEKCLCKLYPEFVRE